MISASIFRAVRKFSQTTRCHRLRGTSDLKLEPIDSSRHIVFFENSFSFCLGEEGIPEIIYVCSNSHLFYCCCLLPVAVSGGSLLQLIVILTGVALSPPRTLQWPQKYVTDLDVRALPPPLTTHPIVPGRCETNVQTKPPSVCFSLACRNSRRDDQAACRGTVA